ncbi:MAG: hypothetical protein D5S00_00130 [Tindallia sp. MSAO_Bac2]|nr:MAG: hypothetical protein D5S00_00130 [Tindallia sp. MSAO_Bac2]
MKKMIVALLITSLLIAGCGGAPMEENNNNGGSSDQASDAQPTPSADAITLSVNSAWAEGNSLLFNVQDFADKVYEKTDGTVNVVWGGGPEAIPPFQLVEALRNGVVDIAWTAHTYNVSNVPVLEAMKLVDAETMRETGGFDFINELYQERLNSHYIAASTNGLTYNLYTKDPIESLDDFSGLTIRSTPAYQAFVEALGAGVVNMDPGEAYQALERNVIQGYGWPSVGVTDFGWQEVSEYIIQPAFYNVDVAIIMSDNAWSQLDENQQRAIMEAGLEVEQEAMAHYEKAIAEEVDILTNEGMSQNILPDDVAERFLTLAYEEAWASVMKDDPDNAALLQEYTRYEP